MKKKTLVLLSLLTACEGAVTTTADLAPSDPPHEPTTVLVSAPPIDRDAAPPLEHEHDAGADARAPTVEVCNTEHVDEDGDGLSDCEDPDCFDLPICQGDR